MIARALAGLVLAAAIAVAARRAAVLSPSGAVAAVAVGTASVAAGWSWGALLIVFFLSSSLLSRAREERKRARTAGIVAKGGARDALQVLANGAPFALFAILYVAAPWVGWSAAGAGALAAAAADTWGTEVGTLSVAPPRLLTTGRVVPAGTSGGVTALGLAATLAGALFIGAAAWMMRWPWAVALGATAGGVAGALADSLIGALWQGRRHCPACGVDTERAVHDCGTPTAHAAGARWLDNDGVNLLSGLIGAGVAVATAVLA